MLFVKDKSKLIKASLFCLGNCVSVLLTRLMGNRLVTTKDFAGSYSRIKLLHQLYCFLYYLPPQVIVGTVDLSPGAGRIIKPTYRVLIKYCVFSRILKYIPDSGLCWFSLNVSLCTLGFTL